MAKSEMAKSDRAKSDRERTVRLSVIVPTLQAAAGLGAALDSVSSAPALGDVETIVVDGGSTDGTRAVAAAKGARLISAPRGRGGQLARGADAAQGEWFLFLHADTVLDAGWDRAAAAFIADPGSRARAAAFRFALDDDRPAARRLEKLVAWRCRRLGLPYGDQGLLIARDFYRALGGFRPLPLMEDVDLARRIGRTRFAFLPPAARSSAVRYRRDGYLRRPLRNLVCLTLYFLGLPPRLIARLYG